MRPFYGLMLLLLAAWAGGLQGQARPFPRVLAMKPGLVCDRPGCGAVSKASTSLGLAVVGAVGGLLLRRTF